MMREHRRTEGKVARRRKGPGDQESRHLWRQVTGLAGQLSRHPVSRRHERQFRRNKYRLQKLVAELAKRGTAWRRLMRANDQVQAFCALILAHHLATAGEQGQREAA